MIDFAPVSAASAPAARTLILAGLRERFNPLREEYLADVLGLPGTYAPPRLLLVGTVEGQVVCCGALTPEAGTCWRIERVSVHADWRGQGLARRTLAELETGAHSRGAQGLVLTTLAGWTSALGLYVSEGFMLTHQTDHTYPDGGGYTALHLHKALT